MRAVNQVCLSSEVTKRISLHKVLAECAKKHQDPLPRGHVTCATWEPCPSPTHSLPFTETPPLLAPPPAVGGQDHGTSLNMLNP